MHVAGLFYIGQQQLLRSVPLPPMFSVGVFFPLSEHSYDVPSPRSPSLSIGSWSSVNQPSFFMVFTDGLAGRWSPLQPRHIDGKESSKPFANYIESLGEVQCQMVAPGAERTCP